MGFESFTFRKLAEQIKYELVKYKQYIRTILKKLRLAFFDLIPIIVVVVFFQSVVIGQPFPQTGEIIVGFIFVVVGLMLFIEGLEIGLFPIGETMAYALAKKGSLFWLMIFSFALGFSTTIAEPERGIRGTCGVRPTGPGTA